MVGELPFHPDRQLPLLVADPDHDDPVGTVPLGMVVLASAGKLCLQILQRPGETGIDILSEVSEGVRSLVTARIES
jgi:hypothetical protein